jgi:ABC-2 type transport system permease protein
MTVLLVCEVRRLLRSPRFLIFTAGLPLVYFLLFSGSTRPTAAAPSS